MDRWRNVLLLVAVLIPCAVARADEPVRAFPGKSWIVKTPEEVGLDPAKLDQFAHRLADTYPDDRSCGVITRNGYLVHSWGNPSSQPNWASSSKPVFSTLLLFAVQAGRLTSVDDKVGDWGWELSEKDQPMTFRHLANMISGYACQEAPGQAWNYNDTAIQLYYLTLRKVFATDLNIAAAECFKPLQLEDRELFNHKGRLCTTPRDFARIGWFWVNRGNWAGEQLLERQYFDRYMKAQVPTSIPLSVTTRADDYLGIGTYGGRPKPSEYGPGKYGFNWWFNGPDREGDGRPFLPDAPADIILTMGSRGCNMAMMPSLGLVVAARGQWGGLAGPGRERLNENIKLLVEAVLPDCPTD